MFNSWSVGCTWLSFLRLIIGMAKRIKPLITIEPPKIMYGKRNGRENLASWVRIRPGRDKSKFPVALHFAYQWVVYQEPRPRLEREEEHRRHPKAYSLPLNPQRWSRLVRHSPRKRIQRERHRPYEFQHENCRKVRPSSPDQRWST